MTEDRIASLKNTIARLECSVAALHSVRELMLRRRSGAAPSMLPDADERLLSNARTLKSLNHGLEVLRSELQRAEKSTAKQPAEISA